jgi:hypothetical protein
MRSRGVDLSPLQAAHEARPAWRTEPRSGPEVLAMSKKQEAEVEARLKEFWDDHKDFDSGWARSILERLTEIILPIIFEPSALKIGLEQLYVKSGVTVPRELLEQTIGQRTFVWDEHLKQYVKPSELDLEKLDLEFDFSDEESLNELPAAVLSPLPIFKYALALSAYADYGLVIGIGVEDICGFILDRLNLFPDDWVNDRIIIAAQARWKLDNHESVTPDELAELARVKKKSIMNLAAPGKGGVVLQKSSDDQITSESAMRWLLSRPDFRRSIWQQQKNTHFHALPKQATPSTVEPKFVPVAADGSWFSPAERRDGHYQVGNGDDEKQFDDYWAALDFLVRAASPRWRYADTTDRWRMKMATGWERKAREEIEELLSRSAQMESENINHTRKA